jgi:hypothetical protein
MQHIYSPAARLNLTAPRPSWHIACMTNELSARGLTDAQKAFVKAMVQTGDADLAGRAIGAAPRDVAAWLDDAGVVRAVQASVLRELRTKGVAVAFATLLQIARDSRNNVASRVQASNSLLDRAGMAAARAPDAWKPTDRPLSEYTTQELKALVEAAERQAGDQAKTIEGTVLRADPAPIADQLTDLL